ncbi:MAG TPA: polysaccharide biosynthesis/export family protein [Gemmatirosa sp.]
MFPALAACLLAARLAVAQPGAAAATLSPGDHVQIAVFRAPELSGDFPVGSDGTITHPLYHGARVVGLTQPEVESRVRTVLSRLDANPQFVVQLLLRVSVGGEVTRPNLFTLPPETTIAQAVAQAGGANSQGRLDEVRLVRGGQATTLDLTQPGAPLDATIRSGDQIIVGRNRSVFRDVIAPLGSVIAGIAGVASLIVSANKK